MKKQHSARPLMTIGLLALMLYKLLIAPVLASANTSANAAAANPTIGFIHGLSAGVNRAWPRLQ